MLVLNAASTKSAIGLYQYLLIHCLWDSTKCQGCLSFSFRWLKKLCVFWEQVFSSKYCACKKFAFNNYMMKSTSLDIWPCVCADLCFTIRKKPFTFLNALLLKSDLHYWNYYFPVIPSLKLSHSKHATEYVVVMLCKMLTTQETN